jgi:predicted nucleic acid-binding protein
LGWQLTHLGAGEKDAILLAQEIGADVLIIDERAGYKEAQNRGLFVTGTLGVLEKAANLGLVNLTEAVSRLLATNFRIRRDIVETLLKRHESR